MGTRWEPRFVTRDFWQTTRTPRVRYRPCVHDLSVEGNAMAKKKKGLFLLIAAIGGLLAAKKAKARKDEQDLWSEATGGTAN